MKDELRDKIKDLIIKKTGSLSFLDEDLSFAIADYITENYIPKDIFNDFALKCFNEWITEAQKKKGE